MKEVVEILQDAANLVEAGLVDELRAQGHYLTGRLENSITGRLRQKGGDVAIEGESLYYAGILHHGVRPDRVPYTPGAKTGAGTSRYIQGLMTYFKLRGLGEEEAKRAAFATAAKHKKEGMPTSGSYAYSQTGKRKDFITDTSEKVNGRLTGIMSGGIESLVSGKFNETKSEII